MGRPWVIRIRECAIRKLPSEDARKNDDRPGFPVAMDRIMRWRSVYWLKADFVVLAALSGCGGVSGTILWPSAGDRPVPVR